MKRLHAWWNKRPTREKVLAILALLAACGAGLDAVLLQPQRVARAVAVKQAHVARATLAQLQKLASRHTEQGDAQIRERLAALGARREHAEQIIREAQVDLIAPNEMQKQLTAILASFPQLRVLAVATQTPTLLGEANAANGAAAVASGLYQHGLELQIEGRYLDQIAWFEALEKTPYRIYWRELDLQAGGHGIAVTRIALFTLSRDAAWLRI